MRNRAVALVVVLTVMATAILTHVAGAQSAGGGRLRLELFVAELGKSEQFYTEVLGFERVRGDKGYAVVRLGTVEFGLGTVAGLPPKHYFRPEIGKERKGLGTEIVIEVDDVNAAFERVKKSGHPILTPLGKRPWGATDFRIADPDGYYLRISSAS
ncbi:MAG: VOC family protein [Candidatus Hydrogenedentes bacterium]|nr:VOC family protein [Candidatus Hydrogenedentota bacterium]